MASFFEKLKKGMGIEEPIIEEEFKEDKSSFRPFAVARDPEEEKKRIKETKTSKKPKKSLKQSFGDAKEQTKIKKALKEKKSEEIKMKKIEIQAEMPEEKEEEIGEKTPEEMELKKIPSLPPSLPHSESSVIEKQKEKKWPSFNKGEEDKSSSSPFAAARVAEEGQLAIDVYQTENDLVIQSAIAGVKPEDLDISIEKDIITIKGSREKPFKEEGDYFSQECFWGNFSREVILPAEVDPERAAAEMKNGVLTIRIPKILREKKRKIIVRE